MYSFPIAVETNPHIFRGLKQHKFRDFPGGPGVKIPRSQRRGGSLVRELRFHMPRGIAKKGKQQQRKFIVNILTVSGVRSPKWVTRVVSLAALGTISFLLSLASAGHWHLRPIPTS